MFLFKSKKRIIQEIEFQTNGLIRPFKNGDIILENSFVSKNGLYIGNFALAKEYLKYNLVVTSSNPRTVALQLKYKPLHKITSSEPKEHKNNIKGYVGLSDYGSVLFKIGDKIFDANYKPDLKKMSVLERLKYITKMQIQGIKSDEYDIFLPSVIPFNKRGDKEIKNYSDCLIAARNFAIYAIS